MSVKNLVLGLVLIGAGASLYFGLMGGKAHGLPAVFDQRGLQEVVNASGSKLVLVNASASWCPPCKMMKEQTWPDASVEAWVKQNATAVYVDVDADKAMGAQLNVRSIPTIIAMRSGVEVARTGGFLAPAELIAWMEEAKRAR